MVRARLSWLSQLYKGELFIHVCCSAPPCELSPLLAKKRRRGQPLSSSELPSNSDSDTASPTEPPRSSPCPSSPTVHPSSPLPPRRRRANVGAGPSNVEGK